MNHTVGRFWIFRSIALLALLGGISSPCLAQSKLLTAGLESTSQTSRTQGPMVVVWRLESQHTGILRGNLQATIVDGIEVVGRLTSDEMALSTGGQSIRMMLPSIDPKHGGNANPDLKIILRFIGPDFRGNLGEFKLRVPSQWERGLSIAVCDPWQSAMPDATQKFIQSMRFETHYNQSSGTAATENTLSTVPSHFRPRDLPNEPLGYCAFNLLVLMREGLTDLREDQLDAIIDWVHAGGSVCLVPDAPAIDKHHLRFLDRLAGSGVGQEALLVDSSGRLIRDDNAKPRLARYGLGRVALFWGTRENPVKDPADLRGALALLWNLRAEHLDGFLATGTWDRPKDPLADPQNVNTLAYDRNYFRSVRPAANQLAPEPMQSGDQLVGRLIPQTMRLLPLWLVGILLAGYVLLIGPVDYLGLGFLKQRKWTWVLFPVVTLGVTLTTVRLSHWYMGNTDPNKRVVVADMGRDGQIARTSEFRMRVSGTERVFETEVVGGLFTPVDFRRFGANGWYAQFTNPQPDRDNTGSGAPMLTGRMPSHYVVQQFLPQWSPRLNRVFRIPRHAAAESPAAGANEGDETSKKSPGGDPALQLVFDWEQFNDTTKFNPSTLAVAEGRAPLDKAVDAIPDLKEAVVLVGKAHHALGTRRAAAFKTQDGVNQQRTMYFPPNALVTGDDAFLWDICVNSQGGMYNLLSHLAPHGGGDFEDMPLLDSSSDKEWMLVLCFERGDELIVWRKLYTGEK
ncbi:MAG: hypothetical protein NT069_07920 [Planctomycetota bacterium]|nr:hypothetical protein [Planctomycetota bacterium]